MAHPVSSTHLPSPDPPFLPTSRRPWSWQPPVHMCTGALLAYLQRIISFTCISLSPGGGLGLGARSSPTCRDPLATTRGKHPEKGGVHKVHEERPHCTGCARQLAKIGIELQSTCQTRLQSPQRCPRRDGPKRRASTRAPRRRGRRAHPPHHLRVCTSAWSRDALMAMQSTGQNGAGATGLAWRQL